MTDHNTDQARELRRARIVKIRPKAAPDIMPKSKVDEDYVQPMVMNRSTLPWIEEHHHVMFCPACQSQYNDTMVAARILHVGYEDDPLRNFAGLVSLSCFGCGWSEIIPVPAAEKPTAKQLTMIDQMHASTVRKQRERMMRNTPGLMSGVGLQQLGAAYGSYAQQNPLLKYGSGVAQRLWEGYEQADKLRDEAKQAEHYLETERRRAQMISDMAAQLALNIDEEMVQTIKKSAPPPPSILGQHDIQLHQEESAMKEDDYNKRRSLIQQFKEFFW